MVERHSDRQSVFSHHFCSPPSFFLRPFLLKPVSIAPPNARWACSTPVTVFSNCGSIKFWLLLSNFTKEFPDEVKGSSARSAKGEIALQLPHSPICFPNKCVAIVFAASSVQSLVALCSAFPAADRSWRWWEDRRAVNHFSTVSRPVDFS